MKMEGDSFHPFSPKPLISSLPQNKHPFPKPFKNLTGFACLNPRKTSNQITDQARCRSQINTGRPKNKHTNIDEKPQPALAGVERNPVVAPRKAAVDLLGERGLRNRRRQLPDHHLGSI